MFLFHCPHVSSMKDDQVRLEGNVGRKLDKLSADLNRSKKGIASELVDSCKTEDGKILCEVELEEVK